MKMKTCQVIFVFDYMTISTTVEINGGRNYQERAIKQAQELIKDEYGLDCDELGVQDVEVEAW